MTKTITILVALLAVACGGEPFSASFEAIPDETGMGGQDGVDAAPGGQPGGMAPTSAGSSSKAGSNAGVAGSSSPHAGAAGAAGAPSDTCEFSPARLTAALPAAFAWKDFSMAQGNVCASCTYEPCSPMATSWGSPTMRGDEVVYQPVYTPNATVPLLVRVTKNDGQCSGGAQCEVKPTAASVSFSVALKGDAWQVTDVTAHVTFADSECTVGQGGAPGELTGALAADLQQEIRSALIGLKIPCD